LSLVRLVFFALDPSFAACRATHTTVMCAAFPHACTGAATPLLLAATARRTSRAFLLARQVSVIEEATKRDDRSQEASKRDHRRRGAAEAALVK